MSTGSLESFHPGFSDSPLPALSYGLPFPEACAKHTSTGPLQASRIYIIASQTLSKNTDALQRLRDALGEKVVGVRVGMTPHTLWSECLEVVKDVMAQKAEVIVTLGAGSLTDAAKIVALAIANNALTIESLVPLYSHDRLYIDPTIVAPSIPIISIPTSLSGGEYTDLAGGTRDDTHEKLVFTQAKGPSIVILDPQLTTTTPEWVWLSTGVRSVDHCVETLCSLYSTETADTAAAEGLSGLLPALLTTKANPNDLKARLQAQLAGVKAINPARQGIPLGASHGIGHQLGPLGVGHGETSCILLPAVCRFNVSVNSERQELVKGLLWGDELVKAVLVAAGLSEESSDLADALDAIIKALGMPRTLSEKGVGRDQFDVLAANSLRDKCCITNPISLTEKSQVLSILEDVAG